MSSDRGDVLELRYGNRATSIPRSLSYNAARSAAQAYFNLGDGLDFSFHRPWSTASGTYDRIGSESWATVARVSSAVRVEVRTRMDTDTRAEAAFVAPAVLEPWPDPPLPTILGPRPPIFGHPLLQPPSHDPSLTGAAYTIFGGPASNALPGPSRTTVVPPRQPTLSQIANALRAAPRSITPEGAVAQSSSSSNTDGWGPIPDAWGDDVLLGSQVVAQGSRARAPLLPPVPPPPPYSRHPTEENARKVTFLVSTPFGEIVTLSAKRSVRASKALEAACNIFKLQPSKCRLHHAGWVYGSSEMERLTLQSLDIDDGDRLGISWDDIIVRSELWLYRDDRTQPQPRVGQQDAVVGGTARPARVIVSLAPHWCFDAVLPPAPIDARGPATGSRISWQVRLQTDGNLLVTNAPRTVPCLSWESQAKPIVRSHNTREAVDPPEPQHPSEAVSVTQPQQQQQQPNLYPTTGPPLGLSSASSGVTVPIVLPAGTTRDVSGLVPFISARYISFLTAVLMGMFELIGRFLSLSENGSRRKRKTALSNVPRGVDPMLLQDNGPFDPMESSAFLNDRNSVLLKASDARTYLQETYRDMGVPNVITQKFLSQRMPAITRHRYIALRFISKAGWHKSSKLRVSPEPASILRAVLVYSGVQSDEINAWPKAKARGAAQYDGSWRVVVNGGDRSGPAEEEEEEEEDPDDEVGLRAVELGWVEVFQDD